MQFIRSCVLSLCAALCAALVAHILIDVLGDVVLAHDSYDDIAHDSRWASALAAAVSAAGIALAGLRGAVLEARGREAGFCRALEALAPARYVDFAIRVSIGTFVALVVMARADDFIAGAPMAGLDELLGGSLALGAIASVMCAIVFSCVVWLLFKRAIAIHRHIVAFAKTFVHRTIDGCESSAVRFRSRACRIRRCVRGRPFAGRAPPMLSSVR